MGCEAFTGLDGGALHGRAGIEQVGGTDMACVEEHIDRRLSLLQFEVFVLVLCIFATSCPGLIHRLFRFLARQPYLQTTLRSLALPLLRPHAARQLRRASGQPDGFHAATQPAIITYDGV